jgi:type I restriction-modification system DNA methylase subunit/predicted type IV restriction endonuclease
MSLPEKIQKLIETFHYNLESYKKGTYNETQVRREFIDPFFEELGWDIANKQGYAEAYKDVIHEDAIKVGGVTKAPDYCFRIGGVRKFFLEAKKPAVNIREDIHPAYQLRRYGWSAKLPLSILTDFEEFAVYDCRTKPAPTDKASHSRMLYMRYSDYAERWEEIAGIFSREAILKGSFDKYVESRKVKKGTTEVDTAFLQEIERWRESLARNIALRNADLSQRELNFAVQRTVDRIVFLRICEDRGVEEYGTLAALQKGGNVYKQLFKLFRKADDRYNSGLFHFKKEKDRESFDNLTPKLGIDDAVLKDIFRNLYYPDSPYEFSVLPADILGQVYEKFLGKVIRLMPKHQAVIEDKPEVRKAGGVYYTPTYIVNYIVKETVGRLLEGKKPGAKDGMSHLRILDPACGSGSFLIGAYQFLLDWHLHQYVSEHPEKLAKGKKSLLYHSASKAGDKGEWRLTTGERKRILLSHIYGVDIDSQAVEVTKLSLLLKVLEGEDEQSIAQMSLFQERVLPDLANNIKCGNSLIGPDFYDHQQMTFDEEEIYRINAFDWNAEFSEIMNSGGFDAVIGNPPYIRIQGMKEWAPLEAEFYKKKYASASKGNYDIYVVFAEKSLSLLNQKALLGFILPHNFFNSQYGEPLRNLLSQGKHLSQVVHFGSQQVFNGATTYTCLLFLDKDGSEQCRFVKVDDLTQWHITEDSIPSSKLGKTEWNFTIGEKSDLFERLQKIPIKLGDFSKIFVGLQTSADTVFLFKDSKKSEDIITKVYSKELERYIELESELLKNVVRSGKIGRFWAKANALVLFPYKLIDNSFQLIKEKELEVFYPKTFNYLIDNKKILLEREHGKFKNTGWYQLYPKNLDRWEQPKIMLPYMITRLSANYDEDNNYFVNVTTGGFGITITDKNCSMKYITGLLNSKLLDWFIKNVSTAFHGGYFAANKQFLVQLPIRTIDFSNATDKSLHEQMVSLVDKMLDFHKQLAEANLPQEKTVLSRQIEATDRQIDRLVYQLYDLTEDEIKIAGSGVE